MSSIQPLTAARERWLLVVLAGVQVTHIMDFMVMMPLAPQLMRLFGITPAAFGLLVSAYTVSAAIAGFAAGFVVDRFDRRRLLLVLYFGFTAATLLCAVASDYAMLLAARAAAGAFGGVLGSTLFAIVADAIPEVRRGTAMGVVMSAFSISAVAGVPLGLLLAAEFSWRAPFALLTGLSALVWIAAHQVLPPLAGHLEGGGHLSLGGQFKAIFGVKAHWNAFALTIALTLSGFTVIPYIAPYWVGNVGLSERDLAAIYLVGGAATLYTSRWIGRMADKHGKRRILMLLAAASLVPILAVTHAPRMALWQALFFSTPFFILVSGRFIPTMALLSSVAPPRLRGSFMSFNTCIQQLGMGLGAALAGLMIGRLGDGSLTGYGTVGIVSAALTLAAIAASRAVVPAKVSA